MLKSPRKLLSLFGPFLGLIVVYLIFLVADLAVSGMEDASFYTLRNTKTFLTQTVIYGIAALGMTVVIISGGIDLSVGSLVALGAVVTAKVLQLWGGPDMSFWVPLAAALAGIAACAICGLITGAIIAGFGIVSFIVTLGMMQVARGVARGVADQTTVTAPKSWLDDLMVVEPTPGAWHSVAPAVLALLVLVAIMFVVLKYTTFGRRVFAIGSNEDTARLCGIRVRLNKVWVYMLSGAFAGMASVMLFSNLRLGDPNEAVGMELTVIAAVIIGGGSFAGGEGSVVGSLVGALIMAVLRNGCSQLGIPNYVQNIVIGSIIITAVGVDRLRHARQP